MDWALKKLFIFICIIFGIINWIGEHIGMILLVAAVIGIVVIIIKSIKMSPDDNPSSNVNTSGSYNSMSNVTSTINKPVISYVPKSKYEGKDLDKLLDDPNISDLEKLEILNYKNNK